MSDFVNNVVLKKWLEKEISLAMKQEVKYNGMAGLRRHGVARVRAQRILAKLDGYHVPDKQTIPDVEVTDAVSERMREIKPHLF